MAGSVDVCLNCFDIVWRWWANLRDGYIFRQDSLEDIINLRIWESCSYPQVILIHNNCITSDTDKKLLVCRSNKAFVKFECRVASWSLLKCWIVMMITWDYRLHRQMITRVTELTHFSLLTLAIETWWDESWSLWPPTTYYTRPSLWVVRECRGTPNLSL